MATSQAEARPIVRAASTLKGKPVKNQQGENLGTIEELMIDLATGRVDYYVLSFGGVLGIGRKLFAVPFAAMTLDTKDHMFVLEVAKEKLAEAPCFSKDSWPDMTDRSWGGQIYGFYGVRPYWTA